MKLISAVRKFQILTAFLSVVLIVGGIAIAQPRPAENINRKHHPNLAAAQDALRVSFNHISAAEKADEWDLGGHAKRAKELIDQADRELNLSAQFANAHGGK